MRELPVEDGADPFGPDDEVAVAKVAVHEPGRRLGPVSGRWSSSQRRPSSNAGCGSPSVSRIVRYCSICSRGALHRRARGASPARPRGSARRCSRTAAVSHGARPAYSSSRRIRRGIVSPSIRSITKPSPRSSVGVEQEPDGRDGHAGRRRRPGAAGTRSSGPPDPTFEPGSRRSTSPWRSPAVVDRVERPASRATRHRRAGGVLRWSPARRGGAHTSRRVARHRCRGGPRATR